ncbi:hypothetical protein SKAU_G00155130 [Synaphobranchus kaupii]|uniref:Uncharacterized protein n=1 Tax=Synaphobranchus kaupii TaxID=118154 RepID=A0A9Q1FHD7_SYNKA|nr:hypothetical protein SKAU_G00155130 [Synaphobranchus kaupii]
MKGMSLNKAGKEPDLFKGEKGAFKKGVKGHSTAMERGKSKGVLELALCLALLGLGAGEITRDLDLEMCGTWIHGKSRNLWFDVRRGCENVTIAANETTLSVQGKITADCENSSTIPLPGTLRDGESPFCVFWDPLLDRLQVDIDGGIHTLCRTSALQESCCASLSLGVNINPSGRYGIKDGTQKGDVITKNLQEYYAFFGEKKNCKKDFCTDLPSADLVEQAALRSGVLGQVDLPCAQISTHKLEKGFQGLNVTMQAPQTTPLENRLSVLVCLPPSLVSSEGSEATAVLTYYTKITLFQGWVLADGRGPADGRGGARLLNGVLGISVENRVVSNLADPVKFVFRHEPVAKNESTRCVFWDTGKDPGKVTWRSEGCDTHRREEKETECHCDHLTYFAVLVELNPGTTVDHLEALTFITCAGCAVSLCSCVALIILLTRALRRLRVNDKSSIPIHRSLAAALVLLYTLFVLTGVLANVASEPLCRVVGAALHYALLSSFSWMAIEVFSAFWLVHLLFEVPPSLLRLNLVGFGLPAVLVIVLVCINDVYGTQRIVPSDDITNPYKMCWIKDSSWGRPIHFITNVSFLVFVVFSGLIMLVLVLRKVQTLEEWRQNRISFLSIWGLSLLFGCTWGLGLLNFGPLSSVALFFFCIINSLQGFFLMVRFILLDWMNKRGSVMDSSSSGSTQHHKLQEQEKI